MKRRLSLLLPLFGAAIAAVVAAKVSLRRRRRGEAPERDPVEEAGEESFPASDPPSWTLGQD